MPGSATPRPGWWRANDGQWYPPETLPDGWFIDVATGLARQVPPIPPVAQPPTLTTSPTRESLATRTPTFTLDSSPQKPPIARVWRRYLGWPLWAKIVGPIAALVLLGAALDAVYGGDGTRVDTSAPADDRRFNDHRSVGHVRRMQRRQLLRQLGVLEDV